MKKFLIKLKSKLNWVTLVLVVITFMVAFVVGGRTGANWARETAVNNQEYNGKPIKLDRDDSTESVVDSMVQASTKANHKKIINGEMQGKVVFITGIVSSSDLETFNIESSDSKIYFIRNGSDTKEVKNGDKIKIYGSVSGESIMSNPIIDAVKIENL
ncbi:hypothetical protein [Clostridium gasigenes]|uniref:tRNA_anti-like n=1 Tax=Clostridium gasigenes TaxID=94869 RepID=A0A1H0N927_9CLOT|nr:hypothetical protein [Clostridium gasigenes]SDO88830.1 hypothetical protein SAMN04488529_101730 [Clostridium gasigenes]